MKTSLLAAAVAGGVLTVLLAIEFAWPTAEVDPADATGVRPAPRAHLAGTLQGADTPPDDARAEQWVRTILDRPLFTRDRKPPNSPAAAAAAITDLPRLTGVAIGPDRRRAIFAGASGGKPIVVDEGGTIAGYTVETIAPGSVTVQGPGGEKTVAIAFDQSNPAARADVDNPTGGPLPGQAIPGQAIAGQPLPGQPGAPMIGAAPAPFPPQTPQGLMRPPMLPFDPNGAPFGRSVLRQRGNGA